MLHNNATDSKRQKVIVNYHMSMWEYHKVRTRNYLRL